MNMHNPSLNRFQNTPLKSNSMKLASLKKGATKKINQLIKSGNKYYEDGNLTEAIRMYLEAWKVDEGNIASLKALIYTLKETGERSRAAQLLSITLAKKPDDPQNVELLSYLALDLELWEVAKKTAQVFIKLEPNNQKGYKILAQAMFNLEEYDDVISLMQSIIPMFPEDPELWDIVANCLASKNDYEKSEYFYKEALKLDPNNTTVLQNLGKLYYDCLRDEESIEIYNKAMEQGTPKPSARVTLGYLYLRQGNLKKGWENYEYRLQVNNSNTIHWRHGLKRWTDEDLSSNSILICPEQGIGDELLAASCYHLVERDASSFHIGCDRRLTPLLKRSFPNATSIGNYIDTRSNGFRYRIMRQVDYLRENQPDKCPDLYIECASLLPKYLSTPEQFKEFDGGFLIPDPDEKALWQDRLDKLDNNLKVGLCWRSGTVSAERLRGYTKIEEMVPLLKTEGCTFVNLQYGDCKDELKLAQELAGVTIHDWDDIDLKNDIDKAAALTKACDLVISVTSAPGMIAHGVGVPLIWMAPGKSWWNYGQGIAVPTNRQARVNSPAKPYDWDEIIDMTTRALKEYVELPKPVPAEFWSKSFTDPDK